MNKFIVYGSCITRDVFNYMDQTLYKPELTIGQNPISTMFADPFPFEPEDYVIGSNFDRRMLYYDANKLAINKIQECEADFFIFDAICERVMVMEYEYNGQIGVSEKSYVFIDNYLKMIKSEKWKGLKKVRDIPALELGDNYLKDIDRFCEIILKKFPSSRIIFLECNLVKKYIDKDRKIRTFNEDDGYKIITQYNQPDYANEQITRVTKRIKQNMPNIHYIPMPDNIMADATHHFGLHPVHFVDMYYYYAAACIEAIVNERDISKKIIASLVQSSAKDAAFTADCLRKI